MYFPKLALATLLCVLPCWASALVLVTEDDPPHNMMRDGKIVGLATEKVQQAFKRIKATPEIEMMPWSRAYQLALTRADHCVFSAARTAERESLFQWVGPIGAMDWVLYTRADNPSKIKSLEAARKELIGGYLQDVISVWLAEQGYRVETVSNDKLNPSKLLAGRFNYWASSRPRASSLLAKEDLTTRIVPALTFGHTDLYLACNPEVPAEVVQKLNEALREMTKDGTAGLIDARYKD